MAHQSPQKEKVSAASVIIRNDGSFEETWDQVQEAWIYLFPDASTVDTVEIPAVPKPLEPSVDFSEADLKVVRAKPGQAEDIANFVNHLSGGKTNLTRMDIMAAFGEKAYILLVTGEQMIGAVGWQVENLVARIDEVHLENGLNFAEALKVLMAEIEEASRQLMVEAVLVFIEPGVVERNVTWSSLGYKPRSIDELRVNAWKEAARESWVEGTDMLFKQLRVDRVLRPI
jgi:dephospho-CoA kinase